MTETLFPIQEICKSATISPCGKYRYALGRSWDQSGPTLGWCLLNPSTADASIDDPTIRRIIAFSRDLGFGGLEVRNLFALRSPDPAALASHPDPIGPDNDKAILELVETCPVIVAAWGKHGSLCGRAEKVCRFLAERGVMGRLKCLGKNRDGSPKHPLYLASKTGLRPYWIRSQTFPF